VPPLTATTRPSPSRTAATFAIHPGVAPECGDDGLGGVEVPGHPRRGGRPRPQSGAHRPWWPPPHGDRVPTHGDLGGRGRTRLQGAIEILREVFKKID
jgi:hypothetical protein